MLNDIIVATISGVLGSIFGGITALIVNKKSHKSDRGWEIALIVSEVIGDILSASTPNNIKQDDIERYQSDWDSAHRRFYILGFQDNSNELTTVVNKYLCHLRCYEKGEMERDTLEIKRLIARAKATEILSTYRKA